MKEVIPITIQQKIDMACAHAGITKSEWQGVLEYNSLQAFKKRYTTGKFTQEELEQIAAATVQQPTFHYLAFLMVRHFKYWGKACAFYLFKSNKLYSLKK